MIKKLNRVISVFIIIFILVLLLASPAYAMANPDSISIEYYKVFYNVLETGDMLFTVEGKVIYAITPTYTANQAFEFDILNVAGTAVLASTPLVSYGDRPLAIYLTKTRVDALLLTTGTAYQIRIMGNPLVFSSQAGNTVTITLASESYVDQLLGVDGGIANDNPLRNGMISVANNMEAYDSPTDSYLTSAEGVTYLSTEGGDLFLAGIPGLSTMCPILFSTGTSPMSGDSQEHTGTYASQVTPAQQWGSTVANGLTNLGVYLGMSQALAGSVILFVLVIALGIFLYTKTESGIAVLLIISATPFIGAYLGLMPIALAFVFAIVIIVLMGYFFYARGSL